MMAYPQIPQVPSDTKPVPERVEEALREIGVLLLTFAPLDTAVSVAQGQKVGSILFFAVVGLCFFSVALLMERHRTGGARREL